MGVALPNGGGYYHKKVRPWDSHPLKKNTVVVELDSLPAAAAHQQESNARHSNMHTEKHESCQLQQETNSYLKYSPLIPRLSSTVNLVSVIPARVAIHLISQSHGKHDCCIVFWLVMLFRKNSYNTKEEHISERKEIQNDH